MDIDTLRRDTAWAMSQDNVEVIRLPGSVTRASAFPQGA
jgi:hypothetical protein